MRGAAPTYVYFVKPVGLDGPIKIGCSATPTNRLAQLMSWSPFPLELVGTVPGGRKDESYLHSCFADLHTHHEWFRSSPALRSAMRKIVEAQNVHAADADDVAPVGKIRDRRSGPRSASFRLWFSYLIRIRNQLGYMRRYGDVECIYYVEPDDIAAIMKRWRGQPSKEIPSQHPTDAEIARLDQLLADPAAHAVKRVAHRLKPLAKTGPAPSPVEAA